MCKKCTRKLPPMRKIAQIPCNFGYEINTPNLVDISIDILLTSDAHFMYDLCGAKIALGFKAHFMQRAFIFRIYFIRIGDVIFRKRS